MSCEKKCDRDFCECVSKGLKEMRKSYRNARVSWTLSALYKSNMEFKATKMPNVVLVSTNEGEMYLSLNQNKRGWTNAHRLKGTNVWNHMKISEFIKKYKKI